MPIVSFVRPCSGICNFVKIRSVLSCFPSCFQSKDREGKKNRIIERKKERRNGNNTRKNGRRSIGDYKRLREIKENVGKSKEMYGLIK